MLAGCIASLAPVLLFRGRLKSVADVLKGWDIDHLVQELQLVNNYGLLNSKNMEICLCTMKEMSTTLKNCNCGISAVFCSLNRKSLRKLT